MIIFWIIFTIYLLRLAFRYLVPWIMTRTIRKMADRMKQDPYSNQNQSKKEGEVSIRIPSEDEPKIDPNIGEYVDFEDIKENKKPKTDE